MTAPICIYWMMSKNFGDALNPWLVDEISGRETVWVDPTMGFAHHIACGSILNHATKNSTVWGAGLANITDDVNNAATILAVRGPITQWRCKQLNIPVPAVWGDPGLLLPRLYTPKVEKEFKFGIIAHFSEQVVPFYAKRLIIPKGVTVINSLAGITDYIDHVCKCERIISSSLHGLITAGAYGIPAAWATFGGQIGGDGSKFQDYFMSVGISPSSGAVMLDDNNLRDIKALEALPFYRPTGEAVGKVCDNLMKVCPFPTK